MGVQIQLAGDEQKLFPIHGNKITDDSLIVNYDPELDQDFVVAKEAYFDGRLAGYSIPKKCPGIKVFEFHRHDELKGLGLEVRRNPWA